MLHEQAIPRPLSYDELVQRQRIAAQAGFLLTWVDKDMTWCAPHDGRPGRPTVFSDAAIPFCLSIKIPFKLPLRQTDEMVASLLKLAGLDCPLPAVSTLCRRQKTLAVLIPSCRANGPLNLRVDSTVTKVLGVGAWQALQARSARPTPVAAALHLAMEPAISDSRAVACTPRRACNRGEMPVN